MVGMSFSCYDAMRLKFCIILFSFFYYNLSGMLKALLLYNACVIASVPHLIVVIFFLATYSLGHNKFLKYVIKTNC